MAAVALGQGTYTEKDVIDALLLRKCALFVNGSSGVLVEVEQYPQLRACNYWAAGGDLGELLPMEHDIEQWARDQGCSRMEIIGRGGWVKQLAGYRRGGLWMIKDL